MMDRIPVLLDTDPGSDIDDVLALAYLLRQPRCELLGITTVTGDVQKRAAICEMVCAAFGRPDVPIHCGAAPTLVDGPGQPLVPHYDAVSHLSHRMDRPENTAVDFLRNTIRQRPGEITLLTIGPFTNIALLFALDPEIPSLLKRIVTMGGSFERPGTEWNCDSDPAATLATLKRSSNQLWVGLDVTMQCQLGRDEVFERFNKPPLDMFLLMAEQWFEHASTITFHDPLAAALVFEPSLCRVKKGHVEGTRTTGVQTTFREAEDGTASIASSVDPSAFFAEYFARL